MTAPATTRGRLVRAASELLEEAGYATASVAAIAERAGLATGALYRHFPSKAELFVEVFRNVAEAELVAMESAAERSSGFEERLAAVIRTYATSALRNRRLAWALVYEPVDPLVDAERLAYRRRYCAGMADLLREGVRTGAIPEQDVEVAAAAVVGAIAEALVGPLSPLPGGAQSEPAIVAAIVGFCRGAIGLTAGSRGKESTS
ncbi:MULTISPECIES: TetR/AcrR family transcriptional regulator [Actinomadura]|uniref:TetR/AcrR family transcriptional regulator n=1 Tax=Actinomadura yumaensis TaxID=111807 RepID=A0ABW2CRT6_9ACTN|nr:TetR/AcrR family transcriptional regulator [Actinomadura sp. J1-007]MWK36639.1 TetR family transcriptional regulator [Actinomadura sp. J1-007]